MQINWQDNAGSLEDKPAADPMFDDPSHSKVLTDALTKYSVQSTEDIGWKYQQLHAN